MDYGGPMPGFFEEGTKYGNIAHYTGDEGFAVEAARLLILREFMRDPPPKGTEYSVHYKSGVIAWTIPFTMKIDGYGWVTQRGVL